MRFDDAPHAGFRWLVVEKNAAAAIDLDVDESGGEDRIWRQLDGRARGGLAEADAFNPGRSKS